MKKLILITSCVVLFAATSFAQQDTTKTKDKTKQSDQIRTNPEQDLKGWTRVESTEVPANLRETLSGTQYSGWETGTVYRNEAGDMYSLRTSDRNNPKIYYFAKQLN